jgi:beta-lactamase regulating signal transducer with metallopeptidase domain
MDKLFLTVLNMSLTGAFVIAAVCLLRLLLRKAPKIITYCLWAVAGFRLLIPFSIESIFSLMPFNARTIPTDIATQPVPRIESGISTLNNAVSSLLPAPSPDSGTSPLKAWTTAGAYVWLTVAVLMIIYGVASYNYLKRKLKDAAHIEANIYESHNIKSPFVLGVIKPRIYLPVGLSEKEKGYILLHEKTHIRRCDHLVKIAGYFILCLHWFNPLVWLAFLLMNADMEMSCDEHVLKEMGAELKKDYSLSLLSLATERISIGGSPLAFGEGGIKTRIKNVLNFKKRSRIFIIAAVALAAAISAGLSVNRIARPKPVENDLTDIKILKRYVLENPTKKDRLERTMSVILYEDGSANLALPPISSSMLPACTYSFENNELLIIANIDSKTAEGAFSKKDGEVIARFTVVDDNTLVFESGAVFADKGARYVAVATDDEAIPPVLMLYPGVPADPDEAKPIEVNEEGLYTLDHVISAVVYYPGEADIMLCFSGTKPDREPIRVPFPYENTDVHMIRIDVVDIFPGRYEGSVWAVVTDSEGLKHYSNTLDVVYSRTEPDIEGEVRVWLDYYFAKDMPWNESLTLELPEFPNTVFRWTTYEVKAIDSNGEKVIISGMPVWNVYLADLTGDGLPEFCATVSIGSGIVDERIIVYDYATGNAYELSDRMKYDYALYLDNGRLMARRTNYPNMQSEPVATGEPAIVDGRLIIIEH